MEKLNRTQQKHAFTNQKKCTTTQNKHKKLEPGSVAFYDSQPGNGADLFSKEEISKGGDKYIKIEEKKGKVGSIRYKQANNIYIYIYIYSAENKNRNKGALRPEALVGPIIV